MNYKEEYKKCLSSFDYWLKHYVKFIEYNTDTSAGHSIKRMKILSDTLRKLREAQDKEPET